MTPRDLRSPGDDDQDDLADAVQDALDRIRGQGEDEEIDDASPPRKDRSLRLGGTAAVLIVVVLAALRALLPTGHRPGSADAAWDTIYARQEVKVRAQAGTSYDLVRTLNPGDAVKVYRRDSSEWVQIYALDGHSIGFAYRSRSSFDTIPPVGSRQDSVSPAPPPPPPPSASRSAAAPRDTTAICRNGTISDAAHATGTCAGRGGVECWIHHPGPNPPTTGRICTVEDRRKLRKSPAGSQ
jgi:hypothetical protein